MKTRNVENRLALVGALFILVAVAVAARSAFNNTLGIDFPQLEQTSSLVASSSARLVESLSGPLPAQNSLPR